MALVAAGCGDDDDSAGDTTTTAGDTAGGEQMADTGDVTLLSAGEPEETDAYQTIFDDMINAETDYEVEVVPAGDFEQQFQIQAEGGTLDVAAVPQPGAIAGPRRQGPDRRRWRTSASTSTSSTTLLGESFVRLGEYKGKHYGLPTNINLKSMVWYPKDDFDAAGYEVPTTWDDLIALSDQIVADGSSAVVRRLRERRRHRLAGHRLDGGHHAAHRGARRLRPVGRRTRSRSTTRRCKTRRREVR